MKNSAFLFLLLFSIKGFTQPEGEKIFSSSCIACHTIGKGRLVGPDLQYIGKIRNKKWLITYIQSPQSVIKKGDKQVDSLVKEYNGMIMPNQNLNPKQIEQVLAYIEDYKPTADSLPNTTASVSVPATSKSHPGNPPEKEEIKFPPILGNPLFLAAGGLIILLLLIIVVLANVIKMMAVQSKKQE